MYYGHHYVFFVYIIMEILILFFKGKTKYLIGAWAEENTKLENANPVQSKMTMIFLTVVFEAIC